MPGMFNNWEKFMKQTPSFIAGVALAGLLLVACDKSTSPSTTGSLSFSSRYSSGQAPALSLSKTSGTAAVDSIRITRARLVLKDIKFKSAVDSMNFKTGPMVIELNLTSATQTLALQDVPFATYNRIEFDVHRTQPSEISGMSAAEQAVFADFLTGQVYSIIIDGTVYRTGQSDTAFVYRSKVDAQQKYDLVPSLPITESNPDANVTLLISSGSWFTGPGGLVDPTDPNNEGVIDENLKAAIRAFKDNNKDGSKDPS